METNSKVEFIKKQIGEAIKKAEESKGLTDCKAHEGLVDFQVLSIRLTELTLDETMALKNTMETFANQRSFIYGLWKLTAGLMGTGGLLGSIWIVLQIAKSVGGH